MCALMSMRTCRDEVGRTTRLDYFSVGKSSDGENCINTHRSCVRNLNKAQNARLSDLLFSHYLRVSVIEGEKKMSKIIFNFLFFSLYDAYAYRR